VFQFCPYLQPSLIEISMWTRFVEAFKAWWKRHVCDDAPDDIDI
jgi:hypothetical protein